MKMWIQHHEAIMSKRVKRDDGNTNETSCVRQKCTHWFNACSRSFELAKKTYGIECTKLINYSIKFGSKFYKINFGSSRIIYTSEKNNIKVKIDLHRLITFEIQNWKAIGRCVKIFARCCCLLSTGCDVNAGVIKLWLKFAMYMMKVDVKSNDW